MSTPALAQNAPAAATTEADQPSPGVTYGARARHELTAGLVFFTTQNDTINKQTELMLDLSGRFRLLGADEEGALTMDLDAQWSAFVHFVGDEDPEARPNNPNLVLSFSSRFGALRVWGGPGVTLPLAAAIDEELLAGFLALAGRELSGGMRGYLEPWSFQPSHIAFHGRGGLEGRFERAWVGAEMAIGFMPGIEAQYAEAPNLFAWQLRVFGGARPVDLLSFGGQLGIVYAKDVENSAGKDAVIVSLEPFIRTHFGAGFLGLRFLLNLTDTFGFSFDDAGVWGLTFEGGIALE